MADFPDIYADGVTISAGAFGFTLTLTASDPSEEVGLQQAESHIVARVRLSPALAGFIGQGLMDAMKNIPPPPTIGGTQGTSSKPS